MGFDQSKDYLYVFEWYTLFRSPDPILTTALIHFLVTFIYLKRLIPTMVKRGQGVASSRNISPPAPPSHKEHHHNAVLVVGITIILAVLIAAFVFFLGTSKDTLAGQAIGEAPAQVSTVVEDGSHEPLPVGQGERIETIRYENGVFTDRRTTSNCRQDANKDFCVSLIRAPNGDDFVSHCFAERSRVSNYLCMGEFLGRQSVLVKCDAGLAERNRLQGNLFCASDKWVQCPADGFFTAPGSANAPAENENQLCHNGRWFTCGAQNTGHKEGEATCYAEDQGDDAPVYRWVSCVNGQTNEDGTQLCFNEEFQTCSEQFKNIRRPGETNPGRITENNMICDGSTWVQCNLENLFMTSPLDRYVCNIQNEWSDRVKFGPTGLSEVVLTKQDILNPLNVSFNNQNSFSHLTLCDSNLRNVIDQAEICYTKEEVRERVIQVPGGQPVNGGLGRFSENPGPLAIQSLDRLSNGNNFPHIFNFENNPPNYKVLAIYENQEEQPKKVSLIVLHELNLFTEFSLISLSRNIAHGRRVAIKFENQSYLVSQDNEGLFDLAHLKLKHLPTQQEFTNPTYVGDNTYRFTILNGKYLFVFQNGGNVAFQVSDVMEMPASFPLPHTLSQELEIPFNQRFPIILQDEGVAGKVLTICNNDNPRDPANTIICLNNQRILNLQKDALKPHLLGNTRVAFLYKFEEGEDGVSRKKVYLFQLVRASNAVSRLDYNNFINALVDGRRVAIEFEENDEDHLYLLAHPGREFFDLSTIKLTPFNPLEQQPLQSAGTDPLITFSSPRGGEISLKRNYGNPVPPFEIKGLTQNELAPIDMDQNIEIPFFSSSILRFNIPNFGAIQRDGTDNPRSSNLFKLDPEWGMDRIDLEFQDPRILSDGNKNMLAYYHTAQVEAGTPTKTATFHLFYDLIDVAADNHVFTEEFIQTFTTGKRIAFKLDDNYYLLKHINQQDQAAFFDLNNLRITNLDNGEETLPTVNTQVARFEFAGKRIEVEIDDENNLLHFRGVSGRRVLEDTQMGDFYGEIGPQDSVDLGTSKLRQCFKELYAHVAGVRICDDNGEVETVSVDEPTIITVKENVPRPMQGGPLVGQALNPGAHLNPGRRIDPNAQVRPGEAAEAQANQADMPILNLFGDKQSYLLEPNGETGENKRIRVRKIITLNRQQTELNLPDYIDFVNQIAVGAPILNISGTFYLPKAESNAIQDFSLVSYGDGPTITLREVELSSPVAGNGTFVLDNTLITFVQQETNNEDIPLSARLKVKPQYYLPESGNPLVFNSTQSISMKFSTTIHQTPLLIEKDAVLFEDLVSLRIDNLFNRLFAEGDTRIFIFDGQQVEMQIQKITLIPGRVATQEVIITLRRI